jgi:putative spermidine/putrescine transport system ATP-binding protein
MLLDESLSNLDAKLRDAMRHEIREIQRSLGITTLFVTHDQVEALAMCDRVAVMNRGRIEQIGSPEAIYERPATRFVADFVGRINILPATGGAQSIDLWGVHFPVKAPQAGEFDIFVRPQRIRLIPVSEPVAEDVARIEGRVARSSFLGDHVEVIVEVGDGQLIVEIPSGRVPPSQGTKVAAVWPAKDTLLFPREPR